MLILPACLPNTGNNNEASRQKKIFTTLCYVKITIFPQRFRTKLRFCSKPGNRELMLASTDVIYPHVSDLPGLLLCLYILHLVEIWTGVTHAWLTDWLTTLKDRATQLLIKYKSGALVTQYLFAKAEKISFQVQPVWLFLEMSTQVHLTYFW